MIAICRRCHRPFWKYWDASEFPPRGFCTTSCWHERKIRTGDDPIPRFPDAVVREMRVHRLLAHRTASLTGVFDYCTECERLEEEYSFSLSYHYGGEIWSGGLAVGAQL